MWKPNICGTRNRFGVLGPCSKIMSRCGKKYAFGVSCPCPAVCPGLHCVMPCKSGPSMPIINGGGSNIFQRNWHISQLALKLAMKFHFCNLFYFWCPLTLVKIATGGSQKHYQFSISWGLNRPHQNHQMMRGMLKDRDKQPLI